MTDETGEQKEFVIPAYDIQTFPKYLADKLALQMADEILGKRGIKHNYLKDRDELLKVIYVV